ncbi:putative signal peptide protein [Puccinia sorghi]|uniref:Putative signal peptide protein n=1 Tax=Puccinia sorghi TaxID=27349 RepID=A0A0L6UGA8_9BASI|nr:putative signal peptide protein [Puccinia sorghi]
MFNIILVLWLSNGMTSEINGVCQCSVFHQTSQSESTFFAMMAFCHDVPNWPELDRIKCGVSIFFGHPANLGRFKPKSAGPTLKPAWHIPRLQLAYSQLHLANGPDWSQWTPIWLFWGVLTDSTLLLYTTIICKERKTKISTYLKLRLGQAELCCGPRSTVLFQVGFGHVPRHTIFSMTRGTVIAKKQNFTILEFLYFILSTQFKLCKVLFISSMKKKILGDIKTIPLLEILVKYLFVKFPFVLWSPFLYISDRGFDTHPIFGSVTPLHHWLFFLPQTFNILKQNGLIYFSLNVINLPFLGVYLSSFVGLFPMHCFAIKKSIGKARCNAKNIKILFWGKIKFIILFVTGQGVGEKNLIIKHQWYNILYCQTSLQNLFPEKKTPYLATGTTLIAHWFDSCIYFTSHSLFLFIICHIAFNFAYIYLIPFTTSIPQLNNMCSLLTELSFTQANVFLRHLFLIKQSNVPNQKSTKLADWPSLIRNLQCDILLCDSILGFKLLSDEMKDFIFEK